MHRVISKSANFSLTSMTPNCY